MVNVSHNSRVCGDVCPHLLLLPRPVAQALQLPTQTPGDHGVRTLSTPSSIVMIQHHSELLLILMSTQ